MSNLWGKCWLNQGADIHSKYFNENSIESIIDVTRVCTYCKTNISDMWWKCCPKHTSERWLEDLLITIGIFTLFFLVVVLLAILVSIFWNFL